MRSEWNQNGIECRRRKCAISMPQPWPPIRGRVWPGAARCPRIAWAKHCSLSVLPSSSQALAAGWPRWTVGHHAPPSPSSLAEIRSLVGCPLLGPSWLEEEESACLPIFFFSNVWVSTRNFFETLTRRPYRKSKFVCSNQSALTWGLKL